MSFLLLLHSLLRWVVLILLVGRAGASLAAMGSGAPWAPLHRKLGLAALIATDLQLLLGIGLYAMSPLVSAALSDMGAAMKDPGLRFWAVEHPTTMVLAVVAAHVGHALSKRGKTPATQHRAAAIGAVVTLVLLAAGIPWPWREAVGRALIPG